jgi:hypothetical protein
VDQVLALDNQAVSWSPGQRRADDEVPAPIQHRGSDPAAFVVDPPPVSPARRLARGVGELGRGRLRFGAVFGGPRPVFGGGAFLSDPAGRVSSPLRILVASEMKRGIIIIFWLVG